MALRTVTTSPIVIGAAGGTLVMPVQTTAAAASVVLHDRTFVEQRLPVTFTSGTATLTLTSAPLAGTLSVFSSEYGSLVATISGSTITVTEGDVTIPAGTPLVIRYRHQATAGRTIHVAYTTGPVQNIAIPPHTNVVWAAGLNGYIVD